MLGGLSAGATTLGNKTAKSSQAGDTPVTVPGVLHTETCSLKNFILEALWTAENKT